MRPQKDTIQIWNRSSVPAVYERITEELKATLGLSSDELVYQIHMVRNERKERKKPQRGRERLHNATRVLLFSVCDVSLERGSSIACQLVL